jgi:hypothetical protein
MLPAVWEAMRWMMTIRRDGIPHRKSQTSHEQKTSSASPQSFFSPPQQPPFPSPPAPHFAIHSANRS